MRLQKDRTYILEDGTEFHYYAKWDASYLIGKVLSEAT